MAERFNTGIRELSALAISTSIVALFVFLLLSALALTLAARLIIKPISHSLADTVIGVRQLAQGELGLRMAPLPEDEAGQVGQAMQGLADTLTEIVQRIKSTSRALGAQSEELTGTAAHLHQNASDQARVLNEISQAVSATVQTESNIVRSSQEALDLSTKTHELAGDGARSVVRTVDSMTRISASVATTAETIARLDESRTRIGQIVATVESVADQTNLLALNAAIEAARAGEYSRGFGVVAEEIRALAGHSSKATEEIANMLSLIEREVTAAGSDGRQQQHAELPRGRGRWRATGRSGGGSTQRPPRTPAA